jgi:hypothetical protein
MGGSLTGKSQPGRRKPTRSGKANLISESQPDQEKAIRSAKANPIIKR